MLCLFLVLFISSFSSNAFPQLLDKKPSWIETTPLKFNADLIKTNKISKITTRIMDKLDEFPIEDRGIVEVYDFDKEGNVSRFFKTTIKSREVIEIKVPAVYRKGRKIANAYIREEYAYTYDTAFTWFKYDVTNRLLMRRINVGDFFFTWYYDYNQNGFLMKQTYCKETNVTQDKHTFQLGVQTIISTESFDYSFQTASQLKKIFLNDEGKEYRSAIINFNRYYIEENHSFSVGYVKFYNLYLFNEGGKPVENLSNSNSNGDVTYRTTFEYEPNGLLKSEKKYTDTLHTNNITWLYDEKLVLVKTQLDRDLIKKKIGIVKFEYAYY